MSSQYVVQTAYSWGNGDSLEQAFKNYRRFRGRGPERGEKIIIHSVDNKYMKKGTLIQVNDMGGLVVTLKTQKLVDRTWETSPEGGLVGLFGGDPPIAVEVFKGRYGKNTPKK